MNGWRVFTLSAMIAASGAASFAFAQADVEQQTKEARLLIQKLRTAEDSKRAALEERLGALLEQRATAIKSQLSKNPGILPQVALSPAEARGVPDAFGSSVEHEIRVEATADQLFDSGGRGMVKLRDRLGRRLTLWCTDAAPIIVKGSTILIKGYALDDQLVASCSGFGDVTSRARSGELTQPLAIEIASPKQGDVVRQTVAVTLRLPKNQPIAAVSLYDDGALLGRRDSPPYTWRWDTTKEADGPHQLSLRANDAELNVGNAAITVTVDNTPPRISLVAPVERQDVSGITACEALASDVLGIDIVKFLLDGAAISVITQPPYSMHWNTTTVPNGLHALQATAIDRAGNQTTAPSVSVRVLNGNSPPLLTPIGPKSVYEGVTLSFTLQATDLDSRGIALAYKASHLPPWGSFNENTHQFFGTPDFSVASSAKPKVDYPGVLFEVCDTQPTCVREAISITVKNVNRPPVMSAIQSRELKEGEALTITPLITEPDGDAIACTAVSLPRWLKIDPKTCAISGMASFDVANRSIPVRNYKDIRVQACDPEEACAEQIFTIILRDADRRSRLQLIGDKEVDEGRSLKFTVLASDPDRDPVALSASGLPSGASFNDNRNGTGAFSWTPLENQAGTYSVTFEASDQNQSEEETIAITVNERNLSISGVVQDSVGSPFKDLTIEAANANTFTRSVQTDEEGFFMIKDLTPGSYRVRPVFKSGLNLPGNEGYDFEPFYRQIKLADHDQNLLNFTAVPKE